MNYPRFFKRGASKISNDLLDAVLIGGIITQINKALLERILNAEMDFHLNNTDEGRAAGNSRNGYGRKTLKSNLASIELSTPRDRHSTFEPQIIPKRSTKTPMQVLTELNNRGVKDVFVFCVDGLTGFPDAIKGIYPKADIQLCIMHIVRNSLRYVSWKYRKELARDLKEIYHAGTLEGAEATLLRLGEKWKEKSPATYALWERNWENIITIFTYPAEIRRKTSYKNSGMSFCLASVCFVYSFFCGTHSIAHTFQSLFDDRTRHS